MGLPRECENAGRCGLALATVEEATLAGEAVGGEAIGGGVIEDGAIGEGEVGGGAGRKRERGVCRRRLWAVSQERWQVSTLGRW